MVDLMFLEEGEAKNMQKEKTEKHCFKSESLLPFISAQKYEEFLMMSYDSKQLFNNVHYYPDAPPN